MITFGVVLILQLIGAILIWSNRADNPSVSGQPLQTWIDTFEMWQWPPNKPAGDIFAANRSKTERLVCPMLRKRDSGFSARVRLWLARKNLVRGPLKTAGDQHAHALGVCNWLGPKLPGAVPGVLSLIHDYPGRIKDPVIARYAVFALAEMGPEGVDALTSVLTNANPGFRVDAARLLGTSRWANRPHVLRALEQSVSEGPADLAKTAELALHLIRERQSPMPSAGPEHNTRSQPLTNLWDFRRGIVITATSGLHINNAGADLFGSFLSGPEPGHLVFQGDQPDGYTHWIEWETPSVVTFRTFGLLAMHEAANNTFLHAFREFRLLVWDPELKEFKLVDRELPCIPYGTGFYSCCMCAFRNLPDAVTGRRFRLELVQFGAGTWGGPRLLELYAFDGHATRQSARQAICDQEPIFVYTVEPDVAYVQAQLSSP